MHGAVVVGQQRRAYATGNDSGVPVDEDSLPSAETQDEKWKRKVFDRDDGSKVAADQYMFPPAALKSPNEDGERKIFTRFAWGRGSARAQVSHRDSLGPGLRPTRRIASLEADEGLVAGDVVSRVEGDALSHLDGDRTAPFEKSQNDLWEQFEQVDSDPGDAYGNVNVGRELMVDTSATPALHIARDGSYLDVDYVAVLPKALASCVVDMTVRCLFAATKADDLRFIRTLDQTTFSEILRTVEPVYSIDKLASAHLEISSAVAQHLNIMSMRTVAWEYSNVISEVVAIRRSAGIRLTLKDYAVLLRGARDLGNRKLALVFWRQLEEDGHVPDIECYNYYMAIAVFDGMHNANARHKLRVIPFHMHARKVERPGREFRGYRVGAGGVKEKVIAIFSEMRKSGAHANQESFRAIMTAAAREGDLGTVKSILRKIWGVDVAGPTGVVDGRPREMHRDSPLYPTTGLLFTLAHAFGINNDVPTALRLVDYMARHYELNIDLDVWNQLFEWTFVLSCDRTSAKSRVDGTREGQLPPQSLKNLWDTMVQAPYYVEPTMGMYNRLIKNLFYRDISSTMIEKIEEGRQLYVRSREHALGMWRQLEDGVLLSEQQQDLDCQLELLRSRWEYADLLRKRNRYWLKRWVRLLLAATRATVNLDIDGDWSFRQIPRLLWEWRSLASRRVSYEVEGGIVEFNIRTQEEVDEDVLYAADMALKQQAVLSRVPKYVGGDWLGHDREVTLPMRMRPERGGTGEGLSPHWRKKLGFAAKGGEGKGESPETAGQSPEDEEATEVRARLRETIERG